MPFSNFKKYFRFLPYDVRTDVGRADERHRQIALTTLSSGGSKLLAALISFALLPLTLSYLGPERFGLWMTISAAVAMLSFADLGVGSGLMNEVATAHGKGDVLRINQKVSTGLFLLSAIALLFVTAFLVIEPFVPWMKLLNIDENLAEKVAIPTISTVVFWFALSMPAGVAIKVMMGLQNGFAANLWLASANIVGLGWVVSVIHFKGSLSNIATATIAPPIIAGIIAGMYLFLIQRPQLRPRLKNISLRDMKQLAGTSGLFFLLQIAGIIAFQSDYLIVAHYLGPESVAVYAIVAKLFSIPSILISLFLSALWPAYAEANSRGDKEWIYKSFIRSLKLSAAISVPVSVAILALGPWIISEWVGKAINPTWDLMIGFFCFSLVTIFGGNFAVLMNGIGIIKFQVLASMTMAATNIMLSIWLVKIIGVSGAVWGSVISLIFILYLPAAIYIRKYFR